MNWILSLLFFFVLFSQYLLFGDVLLSITGYEKTLSKRLIIGFFFTFFLTFIVGFPCQIVNSSWNLYFVLQSILLIVADVFFIIVDRNNLKKLFINIKQKQFKLDFKSIFKENWICILFILLFTLFSISNQLPMYQMHSDDFYYIGKISNLVGTPALLNENYYSGAQLNELNFDIVRTINTYELSYGYFASIFHIDITFFCRATMVIHNYLFIALIYKEVAKLIVPLKFSQYVLVPFFLFLIPQGALHNSISEFFPVIRSYDLWQFQTAIFYGASVVRVLSLPTLFLFAYPMLKKMDFKKIMMVAMLSLSFVSFSTIFIQVFILFSIVIFSVFFIVQMYYAFKSGNKKTSIVYSILIIFVCLGMLFTKYLDHISFINTDSFQSNLMTYADFDMNWLQNDLIYKIYFFVGLAGLIISKGILKKSIYLFGSIFYIIFKSSFFYEILTLTSFDMFFVIYRSAAASQYFCLFLLGVLVIQIYLKFSEKQVIPIAVSIFSIVSVMVLFFYNISSIVKLDYGGSGISKDGWNFSRILEFDNVMTPDIYHEVGEYFNELPYDNYRFFAPPKFEFDNIESWELGFLMSSNRIQIHERGGFEGITQEDSESLSDFSLNGNKQYSDIKDLIDNYEIDYILMRDEQNTNELLKNGATKVLEIDNVSGPYYLLKIQ